MAAVAAEHNQLMSEEGDIDNSTPVAEKSCTQREHRSS